MLELLPEAQSEFRQAAEWYERRRFGLGEEFAAEVYRGLNAIAVRPRASPLWPTRRARAVGVRRYVLRRFPFVLPYVLEEDLVVVLAVAHARRRPAYWLKRTR